MLNDFTNYYELLELSPNANQETIERTFRYLATKHHPDAGGDRARFSELMKAFETLKDPASRAAYDAKIEQLQMEAVNLTEHANQAGPDTVDRHKLLCLYYARRRQGNKNPGLGTVAAETLMRCPSGLLDFHLWYFREKGWIKREDNGGFSITADGVDRVEAREIEVNRLRLSANTESPALAAPVHA